MENKRPVSPINGVELPVGKPFKAGEEQREKSRQAGKRSVEVRRARKTLREEFLNLLTVKVKGKDGKSKSTQEAISSAMIRQAMMGNTKAFELIRDTIGEKPTEIVNILSADFSALDDAFARMAGEQDDTTGES